MYKTKYTTSRLLYFFLQGGSNITLNPDPKSGVDYYKKCVEVLTIISKSETIDKDQLYLTMHILSQETLTEDDKKINKAHLHGFARLISTRQEFYKALYPLFDEKTKDDQFIKYFFDNWISSPEGKSWLEFLSKSMGDTKQADKDKLISILKKFYSVELENAKKKAEENKSVLDKKKAEEKKAKKTESEKTVSVEDVSVKDVNNIFKINYNLTNKKFNPIPDLSKLPAGTYKIETSRIYHNQDHNDYIIEFTIAEKQITTSSITKLQTINKISQGKQVSKPSDLMDELNKILRDTSYADYWTKRGPCKIETITNKKL